MKDIPESVTVWLTQRPPMLVWYCRRRRRHRRRRSSGVILPRQVVVDYGAERPTPAASLEDGTAVLVVRLD